MACKCNSKQHPLVLVFYLDRNTLNNNEIRNSIVESVNLAIEYKKMNAVAFFLPTDTTERIECINPALLSEEKMLDVQAMIDEINKHFGIGTDLTEGEDITID